MFVTLRRKGQNYLQWEDVISLPDKGVNPFHLLCRYVALTHDLGTPGGTMLLLQCSPHTPLKANTIGGITKRKLHSVGVSPRFGAHSTRGAAVAMYKRLGFTNEQVCEIGKWQNTQAFSQHYLRIGAAQEAKEKITHTLLHTVPLGECAEPEWSTRQW